MSSYFSAESVSLLGDVVNRYHSKNNQYSMMRKGVSYVRLGNYVSNHCACSRSYWIFWDCLGSGRDCQSLILRIPDYVRRFLDFWKTQRLLIITFTQLYPNK